MVRLRCHGIEVAAMIDTGSQLMIMPLNVVLTAEKAGAKLDRLCRQIAAVECDVYDASGNRMDFLGCMETELELVGGKKSKIQMHVKRSKEDVVLLGTNAL
ncbi:unnamed protein product [Nippostrongylus brasiliensis]|uniref:Peptidase A2 domain-containing protein n=1 Tax=Nippostrongylus brasiliensis TaxID=27835 RepID=A0A0N4YU62_NIPBR|nr:unnamed protein product [Nippostrongylus brasiliensis]